MLRHDAYLSAAAAADTFEARLKSDEHVTMLIAQRFRARECV